MRVVVVKRHGQRRMQRVGGLWRKLLTMGYQLSYSLTSSRICASCYCLKRNDMPSKRQADVKAMVPNNTGPPAERRPQHSTESVRGAHRNA